MKAIPTTAVLLVLSEHVHDLPPFAVYYMRQPLKMDYLWAAFCIVGAVYFVFRK